ncbi:MAG: lactate utilization protein [Candidatus Micrarchaeota archaeon]|nr:lactate utilization protein [Candidatus Micrarchaeota archaeon]
MEWNEMADDERIERTAAALRKRGIETSIAGTGDEAREKVLGMIPEGAEVMNLTSITLEQTGIAKEIMESGRYKSLRKMIMSVSDDSERHALRKSSTNPEYGIGSANAVTEDGQVVFASASGSQIPVYSYGATNVIWVVGTQKIVKDLDEAMKRINEYVLPLESERVKKAYGLPGSSVNKVLIIEKEKPGRLRMVLVKEKLGF